MAFLSFPSPTQLKNLANPTDNQDAVTLAYLDTALNGSGNIVVANVSANTVTSNVVTSNNVTANTVTVNGVINLGDVANVKIQGGTDGYVLSTDGVGNLSWVAQTGSSGNAALPSVNVDSFTADGVTNSFQLTVTPASKDLVFINIDGVFQIRDSFDLFGNAISFGSTPLIDSVIEVSTFVVGAAGSGGNVDLSNYATKTYVDDAIGNTTGGRITWNIISANSTLVAFNGYFTDTTGGALTATLPASATLGDTLKINDLAGTFATNNLTLARNGSNIKGVAEDLVIDYNQASIELVYSNSTYGWKVIGL
jgi:hypothetical protein